MNFLRWVKIALDEIDLESCETGIEKAIQDANKGRYELLSYGLVYHDDWGFQRF